MQREKTLMQKLRGNRGSALVGVVVASILIGIGVAGVMGVTGSTINHEAAALENEKAFYAAESGLLLGTRWLAKQDPWPSGQGSVAIIANALSINGTTVDVKDSVGANGIVFIISTATNAKLPYIKQLSWAVDSINGGGAGSIINDLTGVPNGLSGVTIDGPAHFNSDIMFAAGGGSNDNLFINGLVTVHSSNTRYLNPGLGTPRAGYTNDYSFGVYRKTGSFTTGDADSYIQNRYLSHQDSIVLGYTIQDPINLPSSTVNKVATLQFQPAGGAIYTYHNGSSWVSLPFPNATYPNVNNKIFVVPDNANINVYGTVNGQMSLATQGAGDIHIVGELKYANGFAPSGFADGGPYDNSSNYGISMTGSDVLALFSNQNITFEKTWTDAGVSKSFIKTTVTDDAFITGMLYAKNSMIINMPGSAIARNSWFMGTRSAKTFDQNFWNRGTNFNPHFLYDKRFGTEAVKPAGVITSITRFDTPTDSTIGISESNWTERNF